MSLVDAIRLAAAQQDANMTATGDDTGQVLNASQNPTPPLSSVNPTASHGVVRLELLLSPEQLHELLRGLMNGVHSVLTLREAANYLRITSAALSTMAENGHVPAFRIEGKWKFSKTTLDEWMSHREQTVQTNSEATNGD